MRTAPIGGHQDGDPSGWDVQPESPCDRGDARTGPGGLGGYDLSGLAQMPADEALAYLTTLPGVGHKTASIVILFCFNGAAFPVDTHIQRISQRLGICGRQRESRQDQSNLGRFLPPETFYSLHIDLIHHGRRTCQALAPHCDVCPLQELCDYFGGEGSGAGKTE